MDGNPLHDLIHATYTNAALLGELDEATIAPALAPGVLNFPGIHGYFLSSGGARLNELPLAAVPPSSSVVIPALRWACTILGIGSYVATGVAVRVRGRHSSLEGLAGQADDSDGVVKPVGRALVGGVKHTAFVVSPAAVARGDRNRHWTTLELVLSILKSTHDLANVTCTYSNLGIVVKADTILTSVLVVRVEH